MTLISEDRKENWREEFDKESQRNCWGDGEYDKDDIKSFISSLLDKQRESIMKVIEFEVAGMAFVDPSQAGLSFAGHASGYNQAIEEVLELLTEIKKGVE